MSEVTKPVLNAEDISKLQNLMETKHKMFLNDRGFKIEARREDAAIYVTVTLSRADRTFYYPVESRMDFIKEDMTQDEAALFLIDYIDLYFEDYFAEEENTFIPIDWANYFYDATDFQMKGQIRNLKLEEMADQILATHTPEQAPGQSQSELLN